MPAPTSAQNAARKDVDFPLAVRASGGMKLAVNRA
jgi:hypothetical protein